ncbi:MAG: hypothetical protein ABIP58_08115 [Dehalococcoidia bacterium]
MFATAFGINVLLGMWRRGLRRFSPAWFLAIHASIPLLFAMRLALGLPIWVIPPEIGFAVLGQVVGARLPPLRGARPGTAASTPTIDSSSDGPIADATRYDTDEDGRYSPDP